MSTSSNASGQPVVNTSCKDCVFAEYEDITQVGCNANNILEKYREAGNVLDAYDDEKEFCVIPGIVCPYYRNVKWKYANASNRLEQARSELTMDYDVVIVVDGGNIVNTLGSLMEQTKRPSKITIVAPNPAIKFDKQSVFDCLVPWTVEERNENENGLDRNHVRNVIRRQKSPLLVYIKAGTTFDDIELFSNLEKTIIDDQFQFGMIKISDSEFIVPKVCYDYFNFMAESTVPSICAVAEQDGVIDLCNLK
jgi:hypothetical protein